MKTRAVRLYGEKDLRLEEFDLPKVKDGEILLKVISDSVCMSTYKTALQGARHVRVPDDVAEHPAIIGHEFCGEIVEVGEKWRTQFAPGEKVIIPPALSYLNTMQTIGYSFGEIGGDATYVLVPEHVIAHDYLLKLDSEAFYSGSLIEPYSCVLRGFKGSLHQNENLEYVGGLKQGGKLAILAGCGPMGLAAIDCALYGPWKPSLIVVTDIDAARLERAEKLFPPEDAQKDGIRLVYSATTAKERLLSYTDGHGYDDVYAYAPVPAVVELADAILGYDGCLNFFAGPTDSAFSAKLNFYQVHYAQHHVAGTSGSTVQDIKNIVQLIAQRRVKPSVMITHIDGLDAVIDTTLNLPRIPGGKKLIYPHIQLPLTALDRFAELAETDLRFGVLDRLVSENNGLWSLAAERYLLEHF